MSKLSELKNLSKLLAEGKYSLLSAANPMRKVLPAAENEARMAALEKLLAEKGYDFERALGKYGAEEPSVMVLRKGSKGERELEELAKQFGQESIYHSDAGANRLKYLSGEKAGLEEAGKGVSIDPNAEDYYTKLGDVKFSGDISKGTIPSRISTEGKTAEELRAAQKQLEDAGVSPYDKRFQFLQQALNRKLPVAAGVAAGGAAMLGGQGEAHAMAPAREITKPAEGEQPGFVSRALEAVDKYTGRPTRAGLSAALSGENPLTAAKESITQDKNVEGSEVAGKLLKHLEGPNQEMMLHVPPVDERDQREAYYPAQAPLGLATEVAADPVNLIGAGTVKGIGKGFQRFAPLIKAFK